MRRIWDTELPVTALPRRRIPAISFHLRLVREVGLMLVRSLANQRFFYAAPERLVESRAIWSRIGNSRSRLTNEEELEARREPRDTDGRRLRPRD